MPHLGPDSESKLVTCHSQLQIVMRRVIQVIDFKVIWGHRGEELQNQLFEAGLSKKRWPDSKHNSPVSMAVDIAPYPIDWFNIKRFALLGGYVMAVADSLNVKLRPGFDWDMDWDITDQTFMDWGHFEVIL